MIASSYPLLNVFWSMLFFALFVIWIFILIQVIIDIFRSSDLSGWGKAGWLIGILVFEVFGVIAYLIVRGGKMHERQMEHVKAQQQSFDGYVREAAAGESTADQLTKLSELKSQGVLTSDEFEAQKAKLLNS
jgi:hypothetical protein